ncbi:MAG: DUF4492 domain-containing protein [Candidatus Cryptobacteroides sp.]
MSIKSKITSVADFYIQGFRQMTWGRELWVLIILKFVILFLVLRLFFFKPVLAGRTEEQKSDFVGERLTEQLMYEETQSGQ